MLKKIVLAASAAAVVLGAGTAALATAGSSSPGPSAKPTASAAPNAPGASATQGAQGGPGAQARGKGHRAELRALGRALHAQWVTRDRANANAFVTHNAIRGEVTAVSASSITVKAQDGVSQTYAVTDATKVRLRKGQPGNGNGNGNGKGNDGGAAGTIGDVHTGDKVAVAGTGTTSLTALHIVAVTD
ncbi:MAG: hypothetical protein QOE53_431 [Pseudonocardiales bacterium]|jgi:hypothetical protein|nr:hypothetical protein [Pseudonocardiales bacterium]